MTTPYSSKIPVKEDFLDYSILIDLVNRLSVTLFWISPLLNNDLGKVEPPTEFKRDGFEAYADGTNWNPGSGKGKYRWNSTTSAWVFVG